MTDLIMAQAGQVTGTEPVPLSVIENLLRFMDTGGPVLYLLLVISILTLTLIIVKLIQFWILRVHRRGFVDGALSSWFDGRKEEALGTLGHQRNPVARVLETALNDNLRGELVKEEVTRVAGLQLDSLRSGLRPLALIANITPLIGLLGTVLGMINAFQALQNAGNKVDPTILSGGIWVALLTTAAGLIIAIPAMAAHNWMEGIVHRTQRAMEDAVTRVFTLKIVPATGPGQPTGAGAGSQAAQPAE